MNRCTWFVGLVILFVALSGCSGGDVEDASELSDANVTSEVSEVKEESGYTFLETFTTNPGGTWVKVGENCRFTYYEQGYIEAAVYRTVTDNRFVVQLPEVYDQTQEFWLEWDWQSITSYEWPRSYFGVFNSQTNNDHNVIADWYKRRNGSEESHRAVARAGDGTTTYWTLDTSYTRPSGQRINGRTKLHYYTKGREGWIDLELWNLDTGTLIGRGSGKVLDGGQSLQFDQFGFGSLLGDNNQPDWLQRVLADNLYFSTEQDADTYFAKLAQERPQPSWLN